MQSVIHRYGGDPEPIPARLLGEDAPFNAAGGRRQDTQPGPAPASTSGHTFCAERNFTIGA